MKNHKHKHEHKIPVQEFDPPLYTRSYEQLGHDLRKAAEKVANADARKLNRALRRFHMIETAWSAARPVNSQLVPVG